MLRIISRAMTLSTCLLFALQTSTFSQPNISAKAKEIEAFMRSLYKRGQFTGTILVADKGQVIYKNAFGMANRELEIPYSLNTTEYIGSVSKQITAMGIMILKDRGKLNYDNSIKDYFPELNACMQPVTILNLLQHTGGLDLFDDFPDMTEQNALDIIRNQKSLHFSPGTKFEYSNGGYTLLGMIIEKISGQSLNEFLTKEIFQPLGMRHTSVNEIQNRNKDRAVGYDMYGTRNDYDTFLGGCASVISTVEDLYVWDQSILSSSLVKKETMDEALKPSGIVMHDDTYGERAYAFGWWVSTYHDSTDLSHNGAFSGFRAYNEILLANNAAIIHISNLRHSIMMEIRTGILNILNGQPNTLPPLSIGSWIYRQKSKEGIDACIRLYHQLKSSDKKGEYNFSESELNSLGYYLVRQNKVDDAIKIFKLNTIAYPQSPNVFDSLGEAYLKVNDNKSARDNYAKALLLDPGNTDIKKRLDAIPVASR